MKPHIVRTLTASIAILCLSPSVVVAQQTNAGSALAAACFTCHGTDGNSVQGVPPSLAGRSSADLFQTMKDFQSGKRPATIMHQQARGYTDEQLRAIAGYFASVKPAPAARVVKP